MPLYDLTSIWRLFSPEQRRNYIFLLLFMVLSACLEMIGIGFIMPVLALMIEPDVISANEAVKSLVSFLGNPSQETLIVLAMVLLVGINAVRVGFLGLLAWKQSQFIERFVTRLSGELYRIYIQQPYVFHLRRNSAQLIRNTTGEVAIVSNSVKSTMMILSEAAVLIGLSGMLFWVDPVGVLIVLSLLLVASWWFNRYTRLKISSWGEQRQQHEGMRIQQLQQGFGGVKEVKVLGIEEFVLNEYEVPNRGSARANQRQTFVQALPRLWLEFLILFAMAFFVIISILQGKGIVYLLPTLGLFAAAAFRFMPSMSRIIGATQIWRFGLPALNKLIGEMDRALTEVQLKPVVRNQSLFRESIEIEDLTFAYPGGHKPALENVTISINKGKSVGFVGSSGAGKSTLIDLLLGLLLPTHGRVVVDHRDIREFLRIWQGQLGYVPQSIFLTDDTLRRNVAFGLSEAQIDDEAVAQALKKAQLEVFVQGLPDGLNTIVGERGVRLSGGQRQRIGIARALYHDPPVLVLDEATSSLDHETERRFMDAVHALHGQKTLLIVAHRLTTVAGCDLVFHLEHGKVVNSGPPSKVIVTKSPETKAAGST